MIASASCRVSAMSAKHVIIYKYISCLFDIQMCSCTNFNFFTDFVMVFFYLTLKG